MKSFVSTVVVKEAQKWSVSLPSSKQKTNEEKLQNYRWTLVHFSV